MSQNQQDYTTEQVDNALLALAAAGGNAVEAVKEIEFDLPVRTLRSWKAKVHKARYEELLRDYNVMREDELAAMARENAYQAARLERQLLDKVKGRMPQMSGREAAVAAQKVADVRSKNVDKLLALTNRPVDGNTGQQDMGEVLKSLVGSGVLTPREQLPAPTPELERNGDGD